MHSHLMYAPAPAPAAATGDYPAVYRNLMVIGLLGSIYRCKDDADTVNTAVEATLEDPTSYRMCRAIALGMGGDAGYAKERLGTHLEQHPDDDNAKVALAVSLMLGGDADWKQPLDNVLAISTDQSAREAATGVLAFLSNLQATH